MYAYVLYPEKLLVIVTRVPYEHVPVKNHWRRPAPLTHHPPPCLTMQAPCTARTIRGALRLIISIVILSDEHVHCADRIDPSAPRDPSIWWRCSSRYSEGTFVGRQTRFFWWRQRLLGNRAHVPRSTHPTMGFDLVKYVSRFTWTRRTMQVKRCHRPIVFVHGVA